MLAACADAAPDRGLHFYDDNGAPTYWSYGDLDARSRAIASELVGRGAKGERVLLVYPQGLELVAALFGCYYAGAIAVPTLPPNPARLGRSLPRLLALIDDAKPALLATTSMIAGFADAFRDLAPALSALPWLSTDALPAEPPASQAWSEPGYSDVAMLQYTSGTTGTPKGVMLTHENLLSNSAIIQDRCQTFADARMVSWLPFHHDMGLIGGMLQMVYCHGVGVYCSPMAFLTRPAVWPELISQHRGTITGAPNFALDLAAARTPDAVHATLDLSALRTLYCGAEPIRPATLDRFTARFGSRGFTPKVFATCYGLAEATLMVTFEKQYVGDTRLDIDVEQLDRGAVVLASESTRRRTQLVSSGPRALDVEVSIVDPASSAPSAPGTVGEIWVSSPSVSPGYYGRPEVSQEIMQQQLPGSGRRWLRTGDLGFMHDERLFVTGRLKDLVIVQGRNVYPQDIERAAEEAHPALRQGCSVAFGLEVADQERVVLVAELDATRGDPADVARAVRRAVLDSQDVTLQTIVLVKPRSLSKTTSGKVQRQATRTSLLAGELEELARAVYAHDHADSPRTGQVDTQLRAALASADAPARRRILEARILGELRARLPPDEAPDLSRDQGFFDLGLGSMAVAELTAALELALGRPMAASTLFDHPTAARLAAHLAGSDAEEAHDDLDDLLGDLAAMSDADVKRGLGGG
jgi:acyl-CoA synthetase (AMP-forming)/AMP-acid ligase II